MPKYLTNTTYFNDGLGTLIQNGKIITKQIDLSGNLTLSGNIINGNNTIQFDSIYNFINILQNMHIYNTLFVDYNSIQYNVGDMLSRIGNQSFYQPSNFNLFPNIYCAGQIQYDDAGNHIDMVPLIKNITLNGFCDLTNNQTLYGIKTFNSPPVLSGASITAGTIPSSALAGGAYVDLTTNQTIGGLKTFSSGPIMSGINISSNTIPVTSVVGQAVALSGNQTITSTKTFSAEQIFSNNIRLDTGSLILANNTITIPNSTLKNLQYLDATSSIQTQINSSNTNISTLQTKTTNISFSSPKTTISGTTETSTLTFTTLNGLTTNMVSSLQDMSGNILARFIADESTITSQGLLIAGITTITIPAIQVDYNAKFATQLGLIGAVSDRVTTLETKTTLMSYSPTLTKTSFTGTLDATNFQLGNLTSGFNQTVNSQVKLIGVLRLENQLNIVSGFGINVEGGISQSLAGSTSSFAGPVNFNNNITTSGNNTNINSTNTQIGTSVLSTLSVNSTSNFNSVVNLTTVNQGTTALKYDFTSYNNNFNVNSSTINLGTNQGLLALNQINIGSLSSASTTNIYGSINLYGLVYSTSPFNMSAPIYQF